MATVINMRNKWEQTCKTCGTIIPAGANVKWEVGTVGVVCDCCPKERIVRKTVEAPKDVAASMNPEVGFRVEIVRGTKHPKGVKCEVKRFSLGKWGPTILVTAPGYMEEEFWLPVKNVRITHISYTESEPNPHYQGDEPL